MDNWMKIFRSACHHIETSYVDRKFIDAHWVDVREKFSHRVAISRNISEFEMHMTELMTDVLPLSHCQFITPDLSQVIEAQESVQTAPGFLLPFFEARDDHVYVKLSSLSIPVFSWPVLEENFRRLSNDSRPIVLDLRLNTGGAASATGMVLAPFTGPEKVYLVSRLATWRRSSLTTLYPQKEVDNHANCRDVELTSLHPNAQWRTPKSDFRLNQNLLVLIDQRTYSCGELLACALGEEKRSVLIGNKTAGMVVGARDDFDCGFGYRLLLPYVELLTGHGKTLEGIGVEPDFPFDFKTPDTEPLDSETVRRIFKCYSNHSQE